MFFRPFFRASSTNFPLRKVIACQVGKLAYLFPEWKVKGNEMTPDDARMALEQVERTDARLAERMRWPFQRHAMFALA